MEIRSRVLRISSSQSHSSLAIRYVTPLWSLCLIALVLCLVFGVMSGLWCYVWSLVLCLVTLALYPVALGLCVVSLVLYLVSL
jgi:ribose/xylose/arabinose/galactoside ABC-type transport system permease subunit